MVDTLHLEQIVLDRCQGMARDLVLSKNEACAKHFGKQGRGFTKEDFVLLAYIALLELDRARTFRELIAAGPSLSLTLESINKARGRMNTLAPEMMRRLNVGLGGGGTGGTNATTSSAGQTAGEEVVRETTNAPGAEGTDVPPNQFPEGGSSSGASVPGTSFSSAETLEELIASAGGAAIRLGGEGRHEALQLLSSARSVLHACTAQKQLLALTDPLALMAGCVVVVAGLVSADDAIFQRVGLSAAKRRKKNSGEIAAGDHRAARQMVRELFPALDPEKVCQSVGFLVGPLLDAGGIAVLQSVAANRGEDAKTISEGVKAGPPFVLLPGALSRKFRDSVKDEVYIIFVFES